MLDHLEAESDATIRKIEPTAGCAETPVPTATATQPQAIHVIEKPASVCLVRVGSLSGCTNTTSCQGDYIVGGALCRTRRPARRSARSRWSD
jgi:hypothetical protein